MLIKDMLKDLQSMNNQRSILLADQTPKGVGGELRSRFAAILAPNIVKTQWGDGQGAASCELAHLALEAVGSAGSSMALCCVRIFVDVVQAYPSLVVALDLPLPLRELSTKDLLKECGFDDETVLGIIAEGLDPTEWGKVPEHLRHLMAGFQEFE